MHPRDLGSDIEHGKSNSAVLNKDSEISTRIPLADRVFIVFIDLASVLISPS